MLKKLKYFSLLVGLLLMCLALYLIVNPILSMGLLVALMASAMLACGVSEVLSYFSLDKTHRDLGLLLNGSLNVVMAIVILTNSIFANALFVPYVVGLWLCLISVSRLWMAFRMRKTMPNLAMQLMALALLGLVLGLIIASNLFASLLLIAYVVAISLIYHAILSFENFARLRRMEKRFHKP